jgi:hypothetical protein
MFEFEAAASIAACAFAVGTGSGFAHLSTSREIAAA